MLLELTTSKGLIHFCRNEFQCLHHPAKSHFFGVVCSEREKKSKHSPYNETFFHTTVCCCETGDLIVTPHWPDFNAHIMGFLQDMQSKCLYFFVFSQNNPYVYFSIIHGVLCGHVSVCIWAT